MHFYAIRVVDFAESDDLSLHSLPLHVVIEAGLFVNLDRELLVRLSMIANANNSIRSLTDKFPDLVIFE
jgi:hypothetical protein